MTYAFDICIEGDSLTTSTFRKETSAYTLLQADSHHPRWLKDGIPVGQFLCVKRNSTKMDEYRRESKELHRRFRERGYTHGQLRKAKRKVAVQDKDYLLKITPRIITQFGSQWNIVWGILQRHWDILTSTPGLASIVCPSPKMVARRARNLGDMLIQSEFRKDVDTTWLSEYPRSVDMFPCGQC